MPLRFSLDYRDPAIALDPLIDEVFGELQSTFLEMPRGEGFTDYATFERGYQALKRATNDVRMARRTFAADKGPNGTRRAEEASRNLPARTLAGATLAICGTLVPVLGRGQWLWPWGWWGRPGSVVPGCSTAPAAETPGVQGFSLGLLYPRLKPWTPGGMPGPQPADRALVASQLDRNAWRVVAGIAAPGPAEQRARIPPFAAVEIDLEYLFGG